MLNMKQKQAITKELRQRYNRARKKKKLKYLMSSRLLLDITDVMHPVF